MFKLGMLIFVVQTLVFPIMAFAKRMWHRRIVVLGGPQMPKEDSLVSWLDTEPEPDPLSPDPNLATSVFHSPEIPWPPSCLS